MSADRFFKLYIKCVFPLSVQEDYWKMIAYIRTQERETDARSRSSAPTGEMGQ